MRLAEQPMRLYWGYCSRKAQPREEKFAAVQEQTWCTAPVGTYFCAQVHGLRKVQQRGPLSGSGLVICNSQAVAVAGDHLVVATSLRGSGLVRLDVRAQPLPRFEEPGGWSWGSFRTIRPSIRSGLLCFLRLSSFDLAAHCVHSHPTPVAVLSRTVQRATRVPKGISLLRLRKRFFMFTLQTSPIPHNLMCLGQKPLVARHMPHVAANCLLVALPACEITR
jgi:hypothetical protein